MNLFKRNLLAAMFLAALGSPAAVLADEAAEAPAAAASIEPVVTATPALRLELMQAMRARMHEIMQTTDPARRKALMEAQAKDMETLAQLEPPDGMGMRMGPGAGMRGAGAGTMRSGVGMMPGWKSDCRIRQGEDHRWHNDAINQRLDALEKRVDMMQMLLQMMLNR